jgi:hypothetical protein
MRAAHAGYSAQHGQRTGYNDVRRDAAIDADAVLYIAAQVDRLSADGNLAG